ncbi:glycosyltransferase [Endozoicomonas sp. SM1973]|uniref:Glycosyltransferase n=1 Tax=Spartinivicinus marinus TaxID=2994442 RepID=A0A853I1U2_9GAMM|nr:glycosyltransferase [Spartinivicinus marinus]MCX4026106.1 glycosyltransferase [Spartinivicinus marinus]NYZ66589.1 glycosyltransferase [Spartinivicinus marinus]
MTRQKILQLQPKYYIRTSDLHEEIIKGLPKDKFEVTSAYFTEKPKHGDMLSVSEYVKYFELTKKQMKGLRLKAIYSIWKYCRKKAFDSLVVHRFKPFDVMLIANKFLKIPNCISVVHGIGDFDRPFRRWITNLLFDKRWTIVAVSGSVKEYLISKCCCLNDDNVKVITNAIDLDYIENQFLTRDAARQELGLKSDDVVLGTIGRLVKVKGQSYLVDAFEKVQHKHDNTKLVIIGGGQLEHSLKKQAVALGISDRVLFPGEIHNAFRFLKAFDYFVLPSLEEGMPLVIFEAMIAKLPIIATKVGGIPDVLDGYGVLIDPTSTSQLESVLSQQLSMSKIDINNKCLKAYEYVKSCHSVEKYRTEYREVISREK